jgi:hypothetical protein
MVAFWISRLLEWERMIRCSFWETRLLSRRSITFSLEIMIPSHNKLTIYLFNIIIILFLAVRQFSCNQISIIKNYFDSFISKSGDFGSPVNESIIKFYDRSGSTLAAHGENNRGIS